jgi:hypothetical protein
MMGYNSYTQELQKLERSSSPNSTKGLIFLPILDERTHGRPYVPEVCTQQSEEQKPPSVPQQSDNYFKLTPLFDDRTNGHAFVPVPAADNKVSEKPEDKPSTFEVKCVDFGAMGGPARWSIHLPLEMASSEEGKSKEEVKAEKSVLQKFARKPEADMVALERWQKPFKVRRESNNNGQSFWRRRSSNLMALATMARNRRASDQEAQREE